MNQKILILLFIVGFATSCFNKEATTTKKETDRYRPVSAEYADGDFMIKAGISNRLEIADRFFGTHSGVTYSLSNGVLGMIFDENTGILSGIPIYTGRETRELQITMKDSTGDVLSERVFSVGINGDPLFEHQWHLRNEGQDGFIGAPARAGEDINVVPVWERGITGKGIKVAVSDSGVEIDHDDLYENSKNGKHLNFALNAPFVTDYPYPNSPHGTAVAGIIGAKGWNNEGGMGVAPDATISGFQFLGSSNFSVTEMIHQASGDHRIFNYSYGDTYYYPIHSDALYLKHIKDSALNTPSRFYVKAAGNEHLEVESQYSNPLCTSHNANSPMENESPYMLIVGAVNSEGERSSYSNVGSNIWISAFGGEYGVLGGGELPAILTTDLPTCFKGYAKVNPARNNPFEFGHDLNQLCNYTATMNGTSSAAPIVSGVLALMLEAYPQLSFRDAKHILALSARIATKKTEYFDESLKHISHNYSGCSPATHDITINNWSYGQGWVKNAGIYKQLSETSDGLQFHNDYGFGIIDADKAVEMAIEYREGTRTPLPKQEEDSYVSNTLNRTIPDASLIEEKFLMTKDLIVETMMVSVQINHTRSIGEIGVELISPAGTRSILTYVNNSFLLGPDLEGTIQSTSHAFYGEPLQGEWTLRIVDGKNGGSGELKGFRIDALGH